MKRAGLFLITALAVVLAACGPSPKARADEFLKLLPPETENWERDDGETVQLLSSTVSSKGHAILQYTGPEDALAYVVVEAHPTDDAAGVAMADRQRLLLLQGLTFDADRAPQQATAQVAQTDRVWYALFQEGTVVVEINVLQAVDAEEPLSEEVLGELLAMVRNAYQRTAAS
ncbi:MAG: hypothetical protein GX573_17590 [Chloroflexi bacterium]|nr:hypothetical protein [Chloroflexota bacterium]